MNYKISNGFKALALAGTIGGVISPIATISASAATSETPTTLEISMQSKADNQLDAVYPFLELQEDGTIAFSQNLPFNYYTQYNLNELQLWFNHLNEQVRQGTISFNEDFSINQKQVKGGLTYSENYWWGVRHYKSHDDAKSWITQLKGISTASKLLEILGLPGAALETAVKVYVNLLTDSIKMVNDYNNKKGVYIDINWALIYSVKTQ